MDINVNDKSDSRGGRRPCGVCVSRKMPSFRSRTLLLTVVVLLLPGVRAVVYYPPFFNAALQKPLTLTPEDSVCGLSGTEDTYCRSMSDEQSIKSCWSQQCSSRCPSRTSLPHKEDAFNRVKSWPACVTRNSTFGPPGFDPNERSVHFPGEKPQMDCFLELDETWMFQIKLMGSWSLTISVWMYNMLDGAQTGTIFDILNGNDEPLLRLFLMGESLRVQGGGDTPVTRYDDAWRIPRNEWTHLSVTIYEKRVEVFIGGEHVNPSIYEIPLTSTSQSNAYRIGYSNLGYFVGHMQDFRIYMESISNREIVEVLTGNLPDTRTEVSCRCPSSHPALKPDDMNYCVKNPGLNGGDTSEVYRLNRDAYLLEFVNDGKTDTHWISRPDNPPGNREQHSLQLELKDIFEVRHVEILFYSPYPNVIIIERRMNSSDQWSAWQFYSQNCVDETGFPVGQALTSEDDINCKVITTATGADVPYSRGKIVFDILAGRPGHVNGAPDTFTEKLRDFIRATEVRVTIRGYPFTSNSDDDHRYHGVFELQVNATCDCNGHASSCSLDEYPYMCECAPETYTEGRHCDQCQAGAFLDPEKNLYAADLCQLCDCDADGTVNGSMICEEVGGQCECKLFADERACDTCYPGYFNLQMDNPDGCDLCLCETDGTVNASNVCDVITGDCPCKENVEGQACDRCKPSHFALDVDNDDGCTPCACDTEGAIEGETDTCDLQSGQCSCKTNVDGRKCDACKDGFFFLEVKNPDGCKACTCDVSGSINATCEAISGQCFCKPHVTGRTCDVCEEGWFAIDLDDMAANGCSYECACAKNGTLGLETRCEPMGGQCMCKKNVKGRACDQCKSSTYDFGSDIENGCTSCQCRTSGTEEAKITCNDVTGQCECKQNVEGRRCDTCKDGYYGLENVNVLGCMACECDPLGTEEGETCDKTSGQCVCQSGAGEVERGGRTCTSYIDDVDPVFGPMAGGTLITIMGGYFGEYNDSYISLDNVRCPIRGYSSTEMMVICKSPALEDVDEDKFEIGLQSGLPITWTRADATTIATGQNFTYKEDPEIESIQPLKTFLEGGIVLSVFGENLNSVAYPMLEVTLVYMRDDPGLRQEMTFESSCNVTSKAEMRCPTPNITIPMEFISRRKRDLSPQHPRARRQAEDTVEKKLNSDRLQFYLGFKMDGVTIYRNMSVADPQYGLIDVYVNPLLKKFEDAESVRMFRPYWPYSNKYIQIKGEDLDYGATAADYKVMVGDVSCDDIELASNTIICTPPSSRPSYQEWDHKDGEPNVQISVGNIVFFVGTLDYEHSFWENLPFRYGVIGGCVGALVLIILIICCCCCCCRKKKEKDDGFDHPQKKFATLEMRENGKKGNPYEGYTTGSTASYLNPSFSSDLLEILPVDLRVRVEDCLIDYKRMVAGKIIGEGHYGRVHIGRLNDESFTSSVPVAIKTLKENTPGTSEVIQFLEECTMMKDFRHENVLTLVGVVLENNRSYCVLPLMENGDLKSFISNEENLLTVGELIDCGLQIAKGMNYLSEQRFVHRDLACRNCMIDQQLCVKVADFGLSRDIYSAEYYRVSDGKRPLPVKWLALESLDAGVFTTKSDVWSYGILLWELLTRGCTPYPDIQSYDLKNYLGTGGRMDRPDFAPDEMYTLMLSCWDETPGRRPTFYDLILRISDFLEISNSKTVMRDHQSQKIPTVAYRGRSYLSLIGQQ